MNMRRFTKMHGLGNDFVVFDATHNPVNLSESQLRRLADRHFGVGCDQVLIVEPPRSANTEFFYRIFNADGSEVEQCGNGARCFARFVHERGLTDSREIAVGTAGGPITLYLESADQVRVNMGVPVFEPDAIPLAMPNDTSGPADSYELEIDGQTYSFMAVSMGNPHAVMRVNDVDNAPVTTLGPRFETHPRFPQRVNTGFMQVVDSGHIRLRVFERGSGETLACGTGACAAMVSGRQQGWLDDVVAVSLPGGQLTVQWQGSGEPVWMTGPATFVYEGEIAL